MKYISFWVSTFFLLVSCHNKQDVRKEHRKLFPSDSLSFFVGLPAEMEVYDNTLFVHDFYGEKGLAKVVDINKDSTLFSFLEKGVGPNEYISISNLDFFKSRDQDALGIFDVSTKTYRSYFIDSLLIHKNQTPPFFTKRSNLPFAINQLFKVNGGYIANGYFPDGKFALLDDSLTLTKYTGHYRPKPHATTPDLLHSQANLGKSRISNGKNHLANIIFSAGVVEFYSIQRDSIEKKWEYILNELDYKVKDGHSIQNNKVEGFISLDFGDKCLYALYSGTKYNPEAIATYGKEIYKFDFEGNLIDISELDREVLEIKVKGNKLYAIVLNPDPIILIYDI